MLHSYQATSKDSRAASLLGFYHIPFKNSLLLIISYRNLFQIRRKCRLQCRKEKPFWPKFGMIFVFWFIWMTILLWDRKFITQHNCTSFLCFRFLRRRHKYLLKKQSPKIKRDGVVQHHNSDVQLKLSAKDRKYNVIEGVQNKPSRVLDLKRIWVMKLE